MNEHNVLIKGNGNELYQICSNKGNVMFLNIVTLVFVVLKLTGVIDWNWLLVLMPTILGITAWVVFLYLYVKGKV
jgi:hypothetical protein